MKKSNLLLLSGLIATVCVPIGAWMKITHQPGADNVLGIAWIVFAVFYVLTLRDLLSQLYPNQTTKILWLFLILGFPIIGAWIYHAAKKGPTSR